MTKNKIQGIYKITSPSGRIYIGQSVNIEKRFHDYKKLKSCNKQPKIYNSLLKHGAENHIFEIIEECEFEQLNIRERYWQEFYDATGTNGLNCAFTSEKNGSFICTEEMIAKRVESFKKNYKGNWKGKNSPNYGRKASEEAKYKMSIARKGKYSGENHYNFGKERSEETKKKISDAKKGKRMGVECYNSKIILDLQTGIYYFGCREAAEALGVNKMKVFNFLRGKTKNKTSLVYV